MDRDTFYGLISKTKDLRQWLHDNYTPHTTLIITENSVELVQSIAGHPKLEDIYQDGGEN